MKDTDKIHSDFSFLDEDNPVKVLTRKLKESRKPLKKD